MGLLPFRQSTFRLVSLLSDLVRPNLLAFLGERQPLTWGASLLVGILAAMASVAFRLAINAAQLPWLGIMGADRAVRSLSVPLWLKPALGGLCVGAIGVFFPEVLGVGYDTMEAALTQSLPLGLLVTLLFLKTAATAITLGSRLAGGVFSPTLYLGAVAGAAFGLLAARVVPELASGTTVYAILGMGVVAGAVLGAPISTTVMVFELTGGYGMSIALLLTVSIASALSRACLGRSFFHLQLASRGLFLDEGAHRRVGRSLTISGLIQPLPPGESAAAAGPCALATTDMLETALRAFDACGLERLPVADPRDRNHAVGVLEQTEVLKAFNAALIEAVAEEQR